MFSLVIEVSFSGSSSSRRGYGMDFIELSLSFLLVGPFDSLKTVEEAQM